MVKCNLVIKRKVQEQGEQLKWLLGCVDRRQREEQD